MNILCVEDDRGTLALISRSLERACPEDEILTAASGEEAMEIVTARPVDLLVADLVLPGISGIEVLDRAKRHRPEMEAIVITGHATPQSAVQAMQKGARDYLNKPISISLLVEKLEHLKVYILSRRELSDYHYLMSAVEEDVSRTALSLSRRCCEAEAKLEAVANILEGSGGAKERLERIAAVTGSVNERVDA